MHAATQGKHKVAIIGAGFAGLWAARRLAKERDVEVTVIDRNNYHTFLPLLYQVAAAELEPEEIAYPLRGVFRNAPNVSAVMAEVRGIDPERRVVLTEGPEVPYDQLIVAAGSLTTFFGVPGAEEYSYTLKTLEDAVLLRNHLLTCFERAAMGGEYADDPGLLTIVVVGGGPTGVEYAGALAELIRGPLAKDFPELGHKIPRVVLVDSDDGVLRGFPKKLREYARRRLEHMGVELQSDRAVKEVSARAVHLADGTVLPSCTVVWTAGVRGHDVAAAMGLPIGRSGRVEVLPSLQVAAHPEIHVAGDLALPEGQNPPMLAPNATQQGRHAAENILRLLRGEAAQSFSYFDKGSMVTIGRQAAVVQFGKFNFSGFVAWVFWLFVHLAYLIGFRNRIFVLINWGWDYLLAERAVRLILPRTISATKACGKVGCKEEL